MTPKGRIDEALGAVARTLDEIGWPAMVIGGIAVIAHGVPRITRDIDATIAGEGLDLERLLVTCAKNGVAPRFDDTLDFARKSQVVLLVHVRSKVDIDLSLAWLPFELEAIDAAVETTLQSVRVRIARPEDLVIYKVAAWRPQDRMDVERLLALHGASMNLARIRTIAREIAEALDAPDRLKELDTLMRRIAAT